MSLHLYACAYMYVRRKAEQEGKEAKYLIHVYLRNLTGVTGMVP